MADKEIRLHRGIEFRETENNAHSALSEEAVLELARGTVRFSQYHINKGLCNGLNELQNQLCREAWKKDGYRGDPEIYGRETLGEWVDRMDGKRHKRWY